MWRIATDHRPSRAVTVQQTMLAIQRLNPDAFINGNINLLRANQTLRLPSEAEAAALSAGEAAAQVARQSEQWRSPAPIPSDTPAPVDAGEQPARVPPIATRDANGRVEIIAGQADTAVERATRPSSTETTAAANAAGIGAPTTAALEETDRLSREVVELRAALDAQAELARNQLEKRDRQLALLDQRVAELQAEIDRLRAAGPAAVNQQRAGSGWQSSAGVVAAGLGAVVLVLAGLLLRSRRTNSNIEPLIRSAARDDLVRGPRAAATKPVIEPTNTSAGDAVDQLDLRSSGPRSATTVLGDGHETPPDPRLGHESRSPSGPEREAAMEPASAEASRPAAFVQSEAPRRIAEPVAAALDAPDVLDVPDAQDAPDVPDVPD
ncbi:MAG: FimV/HubP family polar landmark protein, partial [Gammaproteobacteria bacterium]